MTAMRGLARRIREAVLFYGREKPSRKGKMYYVQIAPDIQIVDLEDVPLKSVDGEPVKSLKHVEFIRGMCLDPKLTGTVEGLEAAFNIRGAIRGKVHPDIVAIENEFFEALRDVILAPSKPYHEMYGNALVAPQLYPFIEAIKRATKDRPPTNLPQTRTG
jgi:hypothetical protein